MIGYVKKIAVIRGLKGGFSSDGGALSGVVRAETYAGFLKAEVSLINFAPLEGARYVQAIGDGTHEVVFEGCSFEGESQFDLTAGFALIVCCCDGADCFPVATAVSGQNAHLLPRLKDAVTLAERGAQDGEKYDDEAIAQTNYYEFPPESGSAEDCRDKDSFNSDGQSGDICAEEDADGIRGEEGAKGTENGNAAESGAVHEGKEAGSRGDTCDTCEGRTNEQSAHVAGGTGADSAAASGVGESVGKAQPSADEGGEGLRGDTQKESAGEQSCQDENAACPGEGEKGGEQFFLRQWERIEQIFAQYPAEEKLEAALEGSRWAKIPYGEGRHYVFGVIYSGGKAAYICYGVPSRDSRRAPAALSPAACYLPVGEGGYWVLYQDADTGKAVTLPPSAEKDEVI